MIKKALLGLLLSLSLAPKAVATVGTTYYPYGAHDPGGPGNFNCSHLNGVKDWYVAPSDTFGDPRLWNGAPCPANRYGGVPNCAPPQIQHTCGVKLKVSCQSNCRDGAPDVVLMVTDVCPKNHPQNRAAGHCQGGPHLDISRSAWLIMRDREDNVRVSYEVVDPSTPLGPM